MLLSTVFIVRPIADAALPLTLGNAFYSIILSEIGKHDAELAAWLHDTNGPKPITTSPLFGPVTMRGKDLQVQANQTYWLRVTGIETRLAEALMSIEARPPSTLRLFSAQFEVLKVTSNSTDHPRARRAEYESLYRAALRPNRRTRPQVTLRFESPTAFRSQGRNLVLPLPRLVFGSLLMRWNEYAGWPLDEQLIDAFEADIDLERYELRTQMQHFRRYQLQVGFMGECTYGGRAETEEVVVWTMRLLSQFAEFAGVGTRTTMGMGQVAFADATGGKKRR